MNTGEIDEIKKIISALKEALLGKPLDAAVLRGPEEPPELSELIASVNLLIANLSEMNRFAVQLSHGNMDADPPGRRNYLSSYLKELHTQLSGLSWAMRQLSAGHMVSKLTYSGDLYASFNDLVDRIATVSFIAEGQSGPNWNWPVNSWRYHQLLSALNNLRIMVLEVSTDGSVVYANKPARDYLAGLETLLQGNKYSDIVIQYLADCEASSGVFPLFREVYDEKRGAWYKITSDKVEFVDGRPGFLHMIDDISEWKKHENRLKSRATYDALTGVYNRKAGIQAFEEIALSESGYCAAFLDIDGLKYINDTYGHTEGDSAIKTIAGVLAAFVRADDIVCRYGGDEFLIVFRSCGQEEAAKIIRRMQRKLGHCRDKAGLPYRLSFSYGVMGVAEGEGADIRKIIEQIDAIMYRNKKRKKPQV